MTDPGAPIVARPDPQRPAAAFLGIERSLTDRRWTGPDPETERLAEAMAQQTSFAGPLCRTLARLGVPAEDAESYLVPQLRTLLPDPRALRDTQRAAARILAAVSGGEPVAVFADYDVDGGASAALLIDWMRAMGAPAPTLYVPDRIDEGYGPNPAAMTDLAGRHGVRV